MKTRYKLVIAGIAVAVAIITAGQPVSDWSEVRQGGAEEKTGTTNECYSQWDVQLLMESNGWSEAAAIEVLELACEHAVTD